MSFLTDAEKQKILDDCKQNLNKSYARYAVHILANVLKIVDAINNSKSGRGKEPPKHVQIRDAIDALMKQYVADTEGTGIFIENNKLLIKGDDGTVLASYDLKSMEVSHGD